MPSTFPQAFKGKGTGWGITLIYIHAFQVQNHPQLHYSAAPLYMKQAVLTLSHFKQNILIHSMKKIKNYIYIFIIVALK